MFFSGLFPAVIFLSAFLLFQVQPMIGRYALPWFGGGSAVWTTCMLFFQTMLLAGYAYAHWLGSLRSVKLQSRIHLTLLAGSLLFLPIAPRAEIWKAAGAGDPSGRILLMLMVTIGGPYLLLSATTPLVQRWFHWVHPNESPWRLYALSNAASFLALFSYPFVVEPFLRLRTQTQLWSVLYIGFLVLCGWTAWRLPSVATLQAPVPEDPWEEKPSWMDILLWLGLAAFASLVLLGTTNQITQEIAVIPFLWVAPLAIYLLTFILTFESDRWYARGTFAVLAGVLAPVACATVSVSVALSVWIQLTIYLLALFAVCMLCNGELAFNRPAPRYLTLFYLTIAAGGALGGVFAALVAPRIFTQFSEYWIGLAGACILGFLAWMRSGALAEWTGNNFAVRVPLMALIFGGVTSIIATTNSTQPGFEQVRNFYGVLHVSERSDKNGRLRELTHGRVQHGLQYLDASKRRLTTTYYGPHSGVAFAITALPRPRHVAVVGLGTGTLAAWGRAGDSYRFYEINPSVEKIARRDFSFLSDSQAATSVVLGDARVQMERELAAGYMHDFDLIAVDAFSGDAIPMHLLTAQAGDVYRQRLAPGGILALHISNRSLDLEPVTRGLARYLGWKARMIVVAADLIDDNTNGESGSRWVLLTQNSETFSKARIRDTMIGWSTSRDPVITWTDDFASLWPILRFR